MTQGEILKFILRQITPAACATLLALCNLPRELSLIRPDSFGFGHEQGGQATVFAAKTPQLENGTLSQVQ